jgi:hypothetical protein
MRQIYPGNTHQHGNNGRIEREELYSECIVAEQILIQDMNTRRFIYSISFSVIQPINTRR